MIKKFNDFIVEKMGYPDAIRPITDLIKKECQKRLDKWLSSKGEFEDYQELIEIPYEVIKKMLMFFLQNLRIIRLNL